MLEKIAELDYSQSQLKELNAEMRRWLDVADDDMAVLRSENTALRKQVKNLEKIVSDAKQVEAEPSRTLLIHDLDMKKRRDDKIQKLEEESDMMKEQNKKLTAESGMEEAQLGLLHRDEAIYQKNLQLKHSEETVEECSVIIKDLKLINQALREQLENRQDEHLLSLMEEKEGTLSPPLSLADEIRLLAASDEEKTSMSHWEHQSNEDTEAGEERLLKPQSLTVEQKNTRCEGILETAIQRAGLYVMGIFIVLILLFMEGNIAGCDASISISNLWTHVHQLLQPYCRVHYGESRRVAAAGGMKAPRRPRQTRLLPRFCVCGVGLLAAAWIFHLNDVTGSHGPTVDHDILSKREFIQQKEYNNQNDTVSRSAINEFPEDIFTLEQRRHGAVLLHVLCAIYMFHALAIVCDVYFVPSLEKVSENLQLSQDVAGATFMAAGSSAPELFTSLIGVFITKGDVGVGTIVGSAVFNVLVIIGICGIFSRQPISLSWWPLFRDAVFYILSILVLILVIYDEKVLWWETIILISMYGIYIIIMKFNRSLCSLVERHCSRAGQPCLSSLRRTTAVGNVGDCDNDMVPLKPDSSVVAGQDSGVVMVDELLHLHPHQLSFSEASLRLLITPHFPPFTRLRMAGRMIINEVHCKRSHPSHNAKSAQFVRLGPRQRLIRARVGPEDGGATGEEGLGATGAWGRENGTVADGDRQMLEGEREGWYLLTFLSSTLWIALFSYLMVWMVTIISYTLGIPDVIMGITFLAAGTSVPDCMASLIVARQGMGDMAVSNSIGSNIFDVLLGLGFPWALRTLIVSYGSVVTINSKGLVYSVILLLASVTLTVLCVHLNRWRLDRRLGFSLLLLYAIFLLCSVGFERL
ncbi:hypothetical protein INR49_024506 [Caranx melampygus]|nr:hypothetical protein INR49_024506 [Caranx melampygus]